MENKSTCDAAILPAGRQAHVNIIATTTPTTITKQPTTPNSKLNTKHSSLITYLCPSSQTLIMKKIILIALIFISISVTAQNSKPFGPGKFGIGIAAGIPTGTFKHTESTAYEINAQGDLPIGKRLKLTGSIGYWSFTSKKPYHITGGIIPAMVGFKGYLTNSLYFHGQLGAAFLTSGGPESTVFAYSPSFGYDLNKHIDVSLKFMSASHNQSNESYFGVRLGFSF